MADIRRILLDGYPTIMVRDADVLVARDGRTIGGERHTKDCGVVEGDEGEARPGHPT